MSYKQNVEENIQHFAESIGLGELSLNEHDACGLCFDDTLIVNMEYLEEDEALVFVSSVKPMDAHDDAKTSLYEKLLSLNLQHHSMQGAFHALNHDKSEILLIRSMQASSDYGNFESTLEKFVNTLEWVISEVNNTESDGTAPPKESGPKPPPTAPGGPGDMGMMV
ncbi:MULTISPECIES: type III secretion system chaperone [unclassified Endozoicomonas]|uniref:type III secretion system chaperone n=1 Tax=unclassified Endozoicomonas TaxID=2644528 RepID=UPI0021485DB0|nr:MULTISPECIES: type III secretion system chaperone [unclassified Endozoicomonas]